MADDVKMRIGADAAQAVNELGKLGGAFSKVSVAAISVNQALELAAKAYALVAGAVNKLIIEENEQIEAIGKSAKAAGVAVDQYSALAVAVEDAGVSSGSLNVSLKKLNISIADAQKAGSPAAEAFQRLGIATQDANGKMRSAPDVLFDVADALQKMGPGAQAAATAQELLGRSGSELLPVLLDGGKALRDAAAAAGEYGVVLNDQTVKAAMAFNDEMDKLGRNAQGAARQINAELTPALTVAFKALNDLILEARKGIFADTVIAGLKAAVGVFSDLAVKITDTIDGINTLGRVWDAKNLDEKFKIMAEYQNRKNTRAAELGGLIPIPAVPADSTTGGATLGGGISPGMAAQQSDATASWDKAARDYQAQADASREKDRAGFDKFMSDLADQQDGMAAQRAKEDRTTQESIDAKRQNLLEEEFRRRYEVLEKEQRNNQMLADVFSTFVGGLTSGSASGVLKGGLHGALQVAGQTGPYGQAAQAIGELLIALGENPKLFEQIAKQMGPLVESIVANAIPAILKGMPLIATAFMRGVQAGLPELMATLGDPRFWKEVAATWAEAMGEMLLKQYTVKIGQDIGRWFGNEVLANSTPAKWGAQFGREFTNWGEYWGEKAIEPFGRWLEDVKDVFEFGSGKKGAFVETGGGSLSVGGLKVYERGTPFVPQTGPAILHRGEAVIPAAQNRRVMAQNDGPIIIKIMMDGRQFGEAMIPNLTTAIANTTAGKAFAVQVSRRA